MQIKPIKTKIFKQNDNLFEFVLNHLKSVSDNSVIVITSKIVALAEGRVVSARNEKEKIALIKSESEIAIHTKYVWLTVKDGILMASAGVDESNADGKIILLPKDSFKIAQKLRKQLIEKFKLKNLGIIITDSRSMPLRSGVFGVALGYAGFKGLRDYRNSPDIFGRKFKFSQANIADSLATAAVLVMGEGAEQQPIAVISQAPVEYTERLNKKELYIDFRDDLYGPMFAKGNNKGKKRNN
jgi:dihydrofolate synthase / folylpolyglutamate synthase